MELEAQKVEDYMQSAAVLGEQTPLFEALDSMQVAQPACLLIKDPRTGKLAGRIIRFTTRICELFLTSCPEHREHLPGSDLPMDCCRNADHRYS